MQTGSGGKAVLGEEALGYLDALFGYAMALTRDKSEAEDLVQETYLRAVRGANHLGPDSNLRSWLFVIMRNAWLNQLRHRKNGPSFVQIDADEPGAVVAASDRRANPHVVYLRKIERQQVREAIEKLPGPYREIVVLRDLEGFSYQEIASVLDCPAGTVMSRLARARAKLRDTLSSWYLKRQVRAS
jgi:RNA polymerase sigma-70 factor (ECF subfamily)